MGRVLRDDNSHPLCMRRNWLDKREFQRSGTRGPKKKYADELQEWEQIVNIFHLDVKNHHTHEQ